MGMGGQRHPPTVFPRDIDPVPIVRGAGSAPGFVWTGAEGLAPTAVPSQNRQARSGADYAIPAHPFAIKMSGSIQVITLLKP